MKTLSIRSICIIPGHRGVETRLTIVKDRLEAYALGERLATNRLCLVDLIDQDNRIIKRFSQWAK